MELSVQAEDARDLELQQDLEQAHQRYLRATGLDRSSARNIYLDKLNAFTDRVLGKLRPASARGRKERLDWGEDRLAYRMIEREVRQRG